MRMTSKIKTTSKMKNNLKNEDNTASTTLPENFLMTPQLDRHSKTDPKPEMLSAV